MSMENLTEDEIHQLEHIYGQMFFGPGATKDLPVDKCMLLNLTTGELTTKAGVHIGTACNAVTSFAKRVVRDFNG